MLRSTSLPSVLLSLVLLRRVDASGVSFTKPAPGGSYPPTGFDVTWVDGGGDPDMSQLDTYTLHLIVGGITPLDSKVLATIGSANSLVATGHASQDLPTDISQTIENGFYLRMTSNTTAGDQVINYSNRFTFVALNGSTPTLLVDAANAQAGSPTNVPAAQVNHVDPPASSSTPSPSQTPTPTPSSTEIPTTKADEDSGGGLSDGALTGLIIGAVLALIGLISLLVWAYILGKKIRQKRKHAEDIRRARISKAFVDGKAELPANSYSSAELGGSNTELSPYPSEASPYGERFEAPGWAKVAEAPGSNAVHELEGGWVGWEAGSGRRSKAYDSTH